MKKIIDYLICEKNILANLDIMKQILFYDDLNYQKSLSNLNHQLIKNFKKIFKLFFNKEEVQEKIVNMMEAIPRIKKSLKTDLDAIYEGDPAAVSIEEIIVCYPGIKAIWIYRISHILWNLSIPLIPRMMSEYAHSLTGIDIHPAAIIGDYFFIDHGTGIVIGETSVIGHHVKIYHGVTLGALSLKKGKALSGKKRHPTIGNYVTIYSCASIFGGDTIIGDNVTIGSNVTVIRSIEEGKKVAINS